MSWQYFAAPSRIPPFGGHGPLDENKKPGQRDISDLKARLGLKKTAAMPAVQPSQTPPTGQPSVPAPIPAPVGTSGSGPAPAAIPSPFGQPAPQPQPQAAPAPAAPPDPRRDPFAQQQAANLAAFYGIGQVLPGDASGVDAQPISKPKPLGRIVMLAGIGVVVFGLGNACGRIYGSRVEFNRTIDHAVQLRDEVENMGKQLNAVADVLNGSQLTAKGQPDFEMTKKLGDLDLKKPDQQRLFHTNYYHLEDVAIERLMNYYNNTIKLYEEITVHAKKTDADREAIESYMKNGANKGENNYGVILDTSRPFLVGKFVEVGAPVCQEPGKQDCSTSELKGFKYRLDSGSAFSERPVKGKPGEVVVPIEKGPLFKSVASGNPDLLAYKDYLRRVVSIKSLAGELVAQQKDVLADLKRAAERPKVFTF